MFQYVEKRKYFANSAATSTGKVEMNFDEMIDHMTQLHTNQSKIIDPNISKYFSVDNFKKNCLPLNVPLERGEWLNTSLSREKRFAALVSSNANLKSYLDQLSKLHKKPNDGDNVFIMDSLMLKAAYSVIQFFAISSVLYVIVYNDSSLFGEDLKILFAKKKIQNVNVRNLVPAAKFEKVDYGINVAQLNTRALLNDLQAIIGELNVRNELYLAHVPGNVSKDQNIAHQQEYIDNKEAEFNRRKSYVITMVNKNHRVRDSYNHKRFWTLMLFFMLMIMVILTLFATFAKESIGGALVVGYAFLSMSSIALLSMFLYFVGPPIVRYFR
jgi:hypothetical protein